MYKNKWQWHWHVRDDGLYIWEKGELVVKLDPDHFKHLVADLAEHIRWQETEATKKQ